MSEVLDQLLYWADRIFTYGLVGEWVLAQGFALLHLLWRELGLVGLVGYAVVSALFVGRLMTRGLPPRDRSRRRRSRP